MTWQANDATALELGREFVAETDCINREWSTTSDFKAWEKAAGRIFDAIFDAETIWREEAARQ